MRALQSFTMLGCLLFFCSAARAEKPQGPSGELRAQPGGKKLVVPEAAVKADTEGIRLLADGSYDEAVKAFDRSLKIHRRNPRALANRGMALLELGRLDEAIRDFDAALSIAPELRATLRGGQLEARLRRGRARAKEGDVEKALDDFYAAVRSSRTDGRPYAEIAAIGRRTGQHDTCISYASRAIELGLQSAEAFASRASCLRARGRKADALKDLDRAVLLDSTRSELYLDRAKLNLELGRRSAAHRDAKRAVELDPKSAEKLPAALR